MGKSSCGLNFMVLVAVPFPEIDKFVKWCAMYVKDMGNACCSCLKHMVGKLKPLFVLLTLNPSVLHGASMKKFPVTERLENTS